jgi:hypothetical protein
MGADTSARIASLSFIRRVMRWLARLISRRPRTGAAAPKNATSFEKTAPVEPTEDRASSITPSVLVNSVMLEDGTDTTDSSRREDQGQTPKALASLQRVLLSEQAVIRPAMEAELEPACTDEPRSETAGSFPGASVTPPPEPGPVQAAPVEPGAFPQRAVQVAETSGGSVSVTPTNDQQRRERRSDHNRQPPDRKGERGPGRSIAPEDRGGHPRGAGDGQREERPRKGGNQNRLRPELVCWREGMTWAIGIDVPEESLNADAEVAQARPLEEDPNVPGRWRLEEPLGEVSVRWSSGDVPADFPAEPFRIFKLSTNLESGRWMARLTRGRFLLVAPPGWQRDQSISGPEFVRPEPVARTDLLAHHVDIDGNEIIGAAFVKPEGTQVQVPSAASGLALDGHSVQEADADVGPLFLRDPPLLIERPYATVVVGDEGPSRGSRRWRKSAERFDALRTEIHRRGIGWFFLRVYDENEKLIDSFGFRYVRDLMNIEVDGGSPIPASDGHAPAMARFEHTDSCRVYPAAGQSGLKMEARKGETRAVVPPDPRLDVTHWRVEAAGRSVDFALCVERVWWAVSEEDGEDDPAWTDRPLELTEKDFAPTSRRKVVVRFPRDRWVSALRVGFVQDSAYRVLVSPRRAQYAVPLRNLGGHEALAAEARSVPLKLWVEPRDPTHPLGEVEVARVTLGPRDFGRGERYLVLEALRVPRLMSLLSRLRCALPGPTRSLIKELRTDYYRPARRGGAEKRATFVKQALCLLAALLELPETRGAVGRRVSRRWKQRAEVTRERYRDDVVVWNSRLRQQLRGEASVEG